MKFVWIVGDSAVGKMTVGQALSKLTGLQLFHNHMMIEPVIEIFGGFYGHTIQRLRDVIFRDFAKTENYGMIHTFMWAFDMPSDWDYVNRVNAIFQAQGAEIYCVELVAPLEVRLARNETENRLKHKASKRDVEASRARMLRDDGAYRLESLPGEIPFENYLKIDNTHLSAQQAAERIRDYFQL